MASTLTDFITSELYPALYGMINQAFPEMEFRKVGRDWKSPCYMDGTRHARRKDKTIITHLYPGKILEQGGENLSLVDFQMRRTGKSMIDAIKSLCEITGLSLPSADTEAYRISQERQNAIEEAAVNMQKDLFRAEGAEVLSYLKYKRGYSETLIRDMGLGVITESLAKQLNSANIISLPYGVGTDFVLAIPYISGGSIRGFKFRAIDTRKDKYRNSKGLPKKAFLFGLTGLKLTGDREKDRDLTIVEGELDALHAQAIGIDNIVAAAGGEISPEALIEVKAKGIKRITILFDTEDSKTGQNNTEEKILKAINIINTSGLTPFVAKLPSQDGSKVDVDSFLKEKSKEDLEEIIDHAVAGAIYLFRKITKNAIERQGSEDSTPKNLHEYKRQTLQLINSPYVSPTDRDIIIREFSQSTGEYISKESLQEEADTIKTLQDIENQRQESIITAKKILDLTRTGKTQEAIELMEQSVSAFKPISRKIEYSKRLILPTAEEIKNKLRNQPIGIITPYYFGSGDKQQQFILPSGALTFICAPTSHGKSTMLRNIALSVAQNEQYGDVLCFTYEETEEEYILKAENTYIAEFISNNNLRTISTYNRCGEYYKNYNSSLSLERFREKETKFLSLLTSGKLRIFYEDNNDSIHLIELIKYLCKEMSVKAIFIDYIQKLKKSNTRLQRREELREIADDFMKLAVCLKIPVVMAAQLNREAKSPIEMHSQNIAESADIERAANTIMCLWNSAFNPNVKSDWNTDSKKSPEQKHIEDLGFTIGMPGQIYAKLTKHRGGAVGLDVVFPFDGNTGVVKVNPGSISSASMLQQNQVDFVSDNDSEVF